MSRKVAHEKHGGYDEQHACRAHVRRPTGGYGHGSAAAPGVRVGPVESGCPLAEVPFPDQLSDVVFRLLVEGAHDVGDANVAARDEDRGNDERNQSVHVVDYPHHLEAEVNIYHHLEAGVIIGDSVTRATEYRVASL